MEIRISVDKAQYLKGLIEILGQPVSEHTLEDISFRTRVLKRDSVELPMNWDEMKETALENPNDFILAISPHGNYIDLLKYKTRYHIRH